MLRNDLLSFGKLYLFAGVLQKKVFHF